MDLRDLDTALKMSIPAGSGMIPGLNPDRPPTIAINSPDGRTLCTLDVRDGILTADYNPADLTEAARVFFDQLGRIEATYRGVLA